MFKKVVSLLMGVGIGVASVKLISKHFRSNTKNSILPMLYEVRKQRDSGEITETQYRETIKVLHSIASEKDKKEISALLEEKYFVAEDMANTHIELMSEVDNSGVSSLQEFIERSPYEAYINGVIGLNEYSFEAKTIPPEEAENILQSYISRIAAEKEELLEEIKMLNGDINKISSELAKIVFDKQTDSKPEQYQ